MQACVTHAWYFEEMKLQYGQYCINDCRYSIIIFFLVCHVGSFWNFSFKPQSELVSWTLNGKKGVGHPMFFKQKKLPVEWFLGQNHCKCRWKADLLVNVTELCSLWGWHLQFQSNIFLLERLHSNKKIRMHIWVTG